MPRGRLESKMKRSNKRRMSIVFNVVISVILLAAIVILIDFAVKDYNKKTTLDPDTLENSGSTPVFTAYTTDYVLAELESVDSAVEINAELLEYVRDSFGDTAYASIVSYLEKNKDEYTDDMWKELFGASVRVLDYLAHEGDEGYDDCTVIASDKSTCTLSFIGEVVLDDVWKWSPLSVHQKNRDNLLPAAFSTDVISEMKNADILMANHSFAYRDNGKWNRDQANYVYYGSKNANVSVLKEMGIDIVNIGNDHTNDYQISAFNDTIDVLKNAGIAYVGGGVDMEDAIAPRYYIVGGMKIAYVALAESAAKASAPAAGETSSGIVLGSNSKLYAEMIDTAKKNADFVIAYVDFNSFIKGDANASDAQAKLARALVDRGANAVIGSSSTTLQEIEYYEGCPIVYSLGSFWHETDPHNTIIFKINFEDFIPQFYCIPCVQSNVVTSSVLGTDKAKDIFAIITNPSMGKINIADDGLISEN